MDFNSNNFLLYCEFHTGLLSMDKGINITNCIFYSGKISTGGLYFLKIA